MKLVTLDDADALCRAVLEQARDWGSPPVAVAVLDIAGRIKALMAQDSTPPALGRVAMGKANAAVAYSADGTAMAEVAAAVPYAIGGLAEAAGRFVPLPGAVLLRRDGEIVGAVAVAGDTPERDDALSRAAIAKAWTSSK